MSGICWTCSDVLYVESARTQQMVSVGFALPHRRKTRVAFCSGNFLNYVQSHEDVWVCRRVDIT